jgi:hypothetical protein
VKLYSHNRNGSPNCGFTVSVPRFTPSSPRFTPLHRLYTVALIASPAVSLPSFHSQGDDSTSVLARLLTRCSHARTFNVCSCACLCRALLTSSSNRTVREFQAGVRPAFIQLYGTFRLSVRQTSNLLECTAPHTRRCIRNRCRCTITITVCCPSC